MKLVGVEETLGSADLEPAKYTQTRLHISSVVVTVDGRDIDASVPSGILRVVGPIDIVAGEYDYRHVRLRRSEVGCRHRRWKGPGQACHQDHGPKRRRAVQARRAGPATADRDAGPADSHTCTTDGNAATSNRDPGPTDGNPAVYRYADSDPDLYGYTRPTQ